MEVTLKPTKKQHEAYELLFDDITRFLFFGGGAGGGKSWLGCEFFLTQALRYPGFKAFIARRELKRLMMSTYVTFQKVCKFHKIPKSAWRLDGGLNVIRFKNGSTIDLLDVAYLPSDPQFERFGSMEYTQGWFEEASETHFLAFEVLKSRIGRHMNEEFDLLPKLLLTYNPSKEWLYRIVYKPWREGKLDDDMKLIQSLYQDNPYTREVYGKTLQTIKDKATKERLMFGNWEYDDDPSSLMEYDAIVDIFTNTAELNNDIYLIVDVARFGNDRIVFSFWRGLHCYKIVIKTKQGLDVTTRQIRDFASTERIPFSHIMIDEDGLGGGVVDNLSGVKGFVANSTPLDEPETGRPNYQNLKVQCAYKLADLVNNHELAVTCDEAEKQDIIEELEQIKGKDIDKDGKLKLRGKDETKEIIGRSPDIADTMLMRAYFEIEKPEAQGIYQFTPKLTF